MLRSRSILHAPLWRSFAGLAALLVLLGQTIAFVHVAGSHHVVCASHGEVLEGESGCETPPSPEHSDESASHEGHHTCAVLHLWGQAGPVGETPTAIATAAVPTPVPSAPALAPRTAAVATWRLAPKNSPPSA